MRVLYVCTANICRSVSGAQLLAEAVTLHPELNDVEVSSAGTMAVAGLPGCREAPALRSVWAQHGSRPLDRELVEAADLVLVAAREHRTAVTAMAPQARGRMFTVQQAGRICAWLAQPGGVIAAGHARATSQGGLADLPEPPDVDSDVVPAIPESRAERWAWLVAELDAARGMSTRPIREPDPPKRISRWRRGSQAEPPHPDDLPDPHVLGMELHERVYEDLKRATEALTAAMKATMAAPQPKA